MHTTDSSTSNHIGFFRHLAAIFYDTVIVAALLIFATFIILPLAQQGAFTPGNIAYQLYLATVVFLFYGWFWVHRGQTIGMLAWGLQLQTTHNRPITWLLAFRRFVSAIFSIICLAGLGLLWKFFHQEKRALHDCWSGSYLIRSNQK